MAQRIETPSVMQETQVPSLGWEDPLEEGVDKMSQIDESDNLSFLFNECLNIKYTEILSVIRSKLLSSSRLCLYEMIGECLM